MEHFVYDDAGEAIRLIDMGDNFKLSVYGTAESTKEVFDNVPGFELRPDDVMLCTYPKTGRLFSQVANIAVFNVKMFFLLTKYRNYG